ncbi:5-methylcytosine-specific restriction endonuclease McrA [Algoriphagus boseongensis]|uniref:5-methylcytosine-specific restriction endonuclease McrA n=1 Tax=Algoriphagus boseongensis TaxID=1442587 RepID=A0A4R6T6A1_9BACT|nr:HNH endonuclease [Algoriphagus boseongensis]TDQ15237.1 5-methylcytosine-specific restriction endonuclease McrA [Algoriphagus boseongensis]
MEKRVLVLNLDHSPVAVVSPQKAIVLVLLEKANVLSTYDLLEIRTVSRSFEYPAVIRLTHYKNIPYRGVLLNRMNLFRRDKGECQYCGSKRHLTIDHIVPRSKGGKTTWTNLITACNRCNVNKGDKTPEQAGLVLRSEPFKPSLSHFLAEYAERRAEEWLPYLASRTINSEV